MLIRLKQRCWLSTLLLTTLLPGVSPALPGNFPALIPTALAQNAEIRSAFAGVKVPAGATRVTERDLTAGFGLLLGNGQAKEMGLTPAEGEAEVFFWSEGRYKPGRAGFSKTMLQNALTEAGFSYREHPDSANTANPYEEQYNLNSLDLAPVDPRPVYFQATHDAKGITLVGVWLDQKSKNRLVLALARAGFAATPREIPAPPVSDPTAILAKDLKNAMKGVPPPALPAFPELTPIARTVRGAVRDGRGRPIAGAQIVVHSSAAGGFRTSVRGRTNASGVYQITLPAGISQIVNADCLVTYGENHYRLPLHPADGELEHFDGRKGAVEHFVLRTYGAIPGADSSAYDSNPTYGGQLRLVSFDAVPAGGTLEIKLIPTGPLLDGSSGKTILFRYPNRGSDEKFLSGIPLGNYMLQATLYEGGDALPLRAKKVFGESELTARLPVVFQSRSGELASLFRSGVERFDILLEP